jgi:glycosyltransferase involved in cell wall biosynthesis
MASRPRFVLTFLAWSSGLSGGDRHLLEMAARWRDHVEVEVLAPPQAMETIRPFLGDVPLRAVGSSGPRRRVAGVPLALEYIRRSIAARTGRPPKADVVVAASHFTPDAVALARLVRDGALGVAYVYHLVGGRTSLGLNTVWSKNDERLGLRILRRSADVIFASNRTTAQALIDRGFAPEHTAVGIDLSSFRRSNPATAPPRAAFVGRMVHTKGVLDAIQAWSVALAAVPHATLVMVGSGPQREPGEALAARLGIAERVEWRGFVSEEEKRRILGESRLFVAPSYEEGWGISVCEALASGLPVAAYTLSVLDELFGSAYLGVEPGDVNGLARLITELLTDDGLVERLSRTGPEVASRYDVSRVADDELALILARRARVAAEE